MATARPVRSADDGPVLFALGATRPLGERVGARLGSGLAPHEERSFEDGEYKVRPLCSVGNRDVYVIHSLHGDPEQSPSDKLCRMLFFIGALRDAGAARVTAVAPYLCFSRKDRQTKPFDPVTTRYVAQLFEAVGTSRLMTMEVHNLAAFQNAFRCDTDHLTANRLFTDYLKRRVGQEPMAVFSPDPGGVKRADIFREELEQVLGRPIGGGFMEKHRSMGKVSGELLAGDVAGRTVVVIDDLISSGGTMRRVAEACRANGATRVILAATHGVFSKDAGVALASAPFDELLVTDTVTWPELHSAGFASRLSVIDISAVLAEAIRGSHGGHPEDGPP
jgi:ribose-phosphate pyrophosphokinase